MSEIVNLRLARKRAERAEKEVKAAANRAKFGRSKPEQVVTKAKQDRLRKSLDAAKRDEPTK
jgi:hypothetical protein